MEQQEVDAILKRLAEKNHFMNHAFNEPVLVEDDHSVFRMEVRDEVRNTFGMIHGGAICTLADNAAGTAAHTDGRSYVTQGCSFNMMGNQAEGVVQAEGRVIHRGRSTAVVEVKITGESGKVLASASFTMFCLTPDRPFKKVV